MAKSSEETSGALSDQAKTATDKQAEAERAAAEQATANKLREEAAKDAGRNTGYAVAKGLSITSRRGHLDEGEAVSERDFWHGQKDIDDLLSRGALVRT